MNPPLLSARLVVRSLLLLFLLVGAYFFSGFLIPGLAALIIGFASWPLYEKWLRLCGGRTTLAASGALIIIVVGLIVPAGFGLSYAIKEASNFIRWLLEANRD